MLLHNRGLRRRGRRRRACCTTRSRTPTRRPTTCASGSATGSPTLVAQPQRRPAIEDRAERKAAPARRRSPRRAATRRRSSPPTRSPRPASCARRATRDRARPPTGDPAAAGALRREPRDARAAGAGPAARAPAALRALGAARAAARRRRGGVQRRARRTSRRGRSLPSNARESWLPTPDHSRAPGPPAGFAWPRPSAAPACSRSASARASSRPSAGRRAARPAPGENALGTAAARRRRDARRARRARRTRTSPPPRSTRRRSTTAADRREPEAPGPRPPPTASRARAPAAEPAAGRRRAAPSRPPPPSRPPLPPPTPRRPDAAPAAERPPPPTPRHARRARPTRRSPRSCEDGEEEVITLQGDATRSSACPRRPRPSPSAEAPRATARPAGRRRRPHRRRRRRCATPRASRRSPTRRPRSPLPGPAPIGVPNFFIDKFRIPPFLLSIYQAAGIEYGIRWEVLAAINEIETDYGRNLNVSSAGALGWMQFMPATWKQYGTDANGDGRKDPYNPVDAIFAAARYLKAAGGEKDLRRAIFAYNHADWYVDSVLMRARLVGGIPTDLVGSLTGLTAGPLPRRRQGPLRRRPRRAQGATKRVSAGQNAAGPGRVRRARAAASSSSPRPAAPPSPRTTARSSSAAVDDAPGPLRPGPRRARQHLHLRPPRDARGDLPGRQARRQAGRASSRRRADRAQRSSRRPARRPPRQRLFAAPARARRPARPAARAGRPRRRRRRPGRDDVRQGPARPQARAGHAGSSSSPAPRVVAGTILGRIGKTSSTRAPHVLFEIRPAGRGAPRIDPKPILDGWKLLESTAIYRAKNKNPFHGEDAEGADDRPDPAHEQGRARSARARPTRASTIYERRPPATSAPASVDRRVLATLEFLAANGLKPTVSSLYRARLDHRLGQRLAPLDRHRRRHLRGQRHRRSSATRATARSPTSRSAGCSACRAP